MSEPDDDKSESRDDAEAASKEARAEGVSRMLSGEDPPEDTEQPSGTSEGGKGRWRTKESARSTCATARTWSTRKERKRAAKTRVAAGRPQRPDRKVRPLRRSGVDPHGGTQPGSWSDCSTAGRPLSGTSRSTLPAPVSTCTWPRRSSSAVSLGNERNRRQGGHTADDGSQPRKGKLLDARQLVAHATELRDPASAGLNSTVRQALHAAECRVGSVRTEEELNARVAAGPSAYECGPVGRRAPVPIADRWRRWTRCNSGHKSWARSDLRTARSSTIGGTRPSM